MTSGNFDYIETHFLFALLEKPERILNLEGITSKHFYSKVCRAAFNKLYRYYKQTGKFLDLDGFESYITGLTKPKIRERLTELYSEIALMDETSSSKFDYLKGELKRLFKKRFINNKLYEIVVQNEERDNPDKAEELLEQGLLELRGETDDESILQESGKLMRNSWENYQRVKSGGVNAIRTGYPIIDSATGGMQKGKLWLFGAYTSEGKTTTMVNIAHNMVAAKHNIIYITMEELLEDVKVRLEACHSNFVKGYRGVSYKGIEDGDLCRKAERHYRKTLLHWSRIRRGRFMIWQTPPAIKVSGINSMLNHVHHNIAPIDAVFVDYAQLIRPEKAFGKDRYEQSEIVNCLKDITRTFNNGEGIPIATAWQISRKGRNEAAEDGFYRKDSFSETSLSERSSDVMIWQLLLDEWREAGLIKIGICKNKKGPLETKGLFFRQTLANNLIGSSVVPRDEVQKLLEVKEEQEAEVEEDFFDDAE